MSAYSDYLLEVRRLLHDAGGQFWSDSELLDYINDGRDRVVRDTGCYRVLVTGYLSTFLEVYPFGGVTGFLVTAGGTGYVSAPTVTFAGGGGSGAAATATITGGVVTSLAVTAAGTGYTSAPTVTFSSGAAAATASILHADTFDLLNLTLYWGASRVPLAYLIWTEFNARARYWTNLVGRPTVFSVYANNSAYVQPMPDQTYEVDWDTVRRPPAIVDGTTVEVIPFPFRAPVAYWAAQKAKLKEQSYGEADNFLARYKMNALDAINSSFTRRVRNPYAR